MANVKNYEGAKLYIVNYKRGTQYHSNFESAKICMENQNGASHDLCSSLA